MNINGIDIEVEFKKIKNMHLAVYPPDGRVHVSAPEGYSEERIRLYVFSKWVWIRTKMNEVSSYNFQTSREFVSGETHYYKGSKKKLKVLRSEDGNAPYSVVMKGNFIYVTVHKNTDRDHIENLVNEWYRDELRPVLQPFVEKWENIVGQKLNTWDIRQMPKRWGSCSQSKREAFFNLQLAKKPLKCIEYVVAHEIIHLIERTHNNNFKHLLDIYLPNWTELKKDLNEFPL